MKTNHRDGTRKRKDRTNWFGYKASVKTEARRGRRSADKRSFDAVKNGRDDCDTVIFHTHNTHISNRWNHD